jgi:hypothetical protein
VPVFKKLHLVFSTELVQIKNWFVLYKFYIAIVLDVDFGYALEYKYILKKAEENCLELFHCLPHDCTVRQVQICSVSTLLQLCEL